MVDAIRLTDRSDVRDVRDVREPVPQKYSAAALSALNGEEAACCGADCCSQDASSANSRAIPAQLNSLTSLKEAIAPIDGMKLSFFKTLLSEHRTKQFRLVLPDESAVPVNFHITEVAHIQKRFIDCGGRIHTTHTCQTSEHGCGQIQITN